MNGNYAPPHPDLAGDAAKVTFRVLCGLAAIMIWARSILLSVIV